MSKRPRSWLACATAALLVLTMGVSAQAAPRELLYVQATMSRDIHIIDANSLEPVGRIYVGDYTDDVQVSPDGRVLYANAQVHSGNPLGWGANEHGKLMAYRTKDNSLIWSTALEGSPHHLAVSPDGAFIYVPMVNRYWVHKLDARTGQVVQRWHSALGNHGAELTKDGKRLYLGNLFMDLLWAIDTETGQVVAMHQTPDGVRPFALSDDEKTAYYQLSRFHGFEVRDLVADKVVRRVDLPKPSDKAEVPTGFPHTYNHGLKITPDGRYILANGSMDDFLAVYSLPDLKLVAKVPVGDDPNWISVRSDSKVAFVSNRGSDDVSVVDLTTFKEIKRIPAGDTPQRMDIAVVPE